ncbi:MAG: efflux transporter periplasmic adaptor subunit, partial [Xanthomonas sp.]|nr:efflux transporter periplasmic adaptor subunit [Xanthomonas sp.]
AGAGQRTVQIVLPNGQVIDQAGTLDFSDTVVDPATGSVSLRATVPNDKRTLLPGTFVTLRATLGEQKGAFLLPQGAIQRDTVSAYAMIVGKDGNVARKNVVTQQAIGANWLITDGLAAGDQVIVEGLQKVKEGAPAKGITAEQAAAAKAAQAKPVQGKAE